MRRFFLFEYSRWFFFENVSKNILRDGIRSKIYPAFELIGFFFSNKLFMSSWTKHVRLPTHVPTFVLRFFFMLATQNSPLQKKRRKGKISYKKNVRAKLIIPAEFSSLKTKLLYRSRAKGEKSLPRGLWKGICKDFLQLSFSGSLPEEGINYFLQRFHSILRELGDWKETD